MKKLKGDIMSLIQGMRIRNYRALRDVSMGMLWQDRTAEPLTPLSVIIGKNGAGKSSILDAFGFLSDCLKVGVEEACVCNGRGGFEKIRSKESDGSIDFELYFRESPSDRPITYELSVDQEPNGRVFVKSERLRQRRKGQSRGQPFSFLILNNGKGIVWKGDANGYCEKDPVVSFEDLFHKVGGDVQESNETEVVELADNRRLGIATLGALKQHPRISMFRKFIEGWYLSYFRPDAARSLPLAGPQKQLDVHGDNLGNVVQYMRREHPERFNAVLDKIAGRIPGVEKIDTQPTDDGRLLLRFYNKGFASPLYAQQMSDGTLKMFAYLLLLSSPDNPPFVCIEEPENGLYHKLLKVLCDEFRSFSSVSRKMPQMFITTHQPYLVDNFDPREVWILEKGDDGFSKIRRASEDPLVVSLVEQSLPLGSLWYSEYLDGKSGVTSNAH